MSDFDELFTIKIAMPGYSSPLSTKYLSHLLTKSKFKLLNYTPNKIIF